MRLQRLENCQQEPFIKAMLKGGNRGPGTGDQGKVVMVSKDFACFLFCFLIKI